MALLTRAQILSADDLKREEVSVPEWGEDAKVIVREPSAAELDDYNESLYNRRYSGGKIEVTANYVNARAKLLARCVIDADGTRLFTDNDAVALGRKSPRVIGRLFDTIQRLGMVSDESVDDAEKNSESVPTEGSITD